MKTFKYIVIGFALASIFQFLTVQAAPTSTVVQNLFITSLAGNGTVCLQVTNSGLVATSSSACGSGSGGGSFSATGTPSQILVFTGTSTGIGYVNLTFATSTLTIGGSGTTTLYGDGSQNTFGGSIAVPTGIYPNAGSAVGFQLFSRNPANGVHIDVGQASNGNINIQQNTAANGELDLELANGVHLSTIGTQVGSGGTSFFVIMKGDNLTADRIFQFPDVAGTLALTNATQTFSGTTINGYATTTNLTITGLGSGGSPCLVVGSGGAVSTSTCGSGGGGGLGTSTGGAYTVGNIFYVINSSTAEAINALNYATSTGLFSAPSGTFSGKLSVGTSTFLTTSTVLFVGTTTASAIVLNQPGTQASPALNFFGTGASGGFYNGSNCNCIVFEESGSTDEVSFQKNGNNWTAAPGWQLDFVTAAGLNAGGLTTDTNFSRANNGGFAIGNTSVRGNTSGTLYDSFEQVTNSINVGSGASSTATSSVFAFQNFGVATNSSEYSASSTVTAGFTVGGATTLNSSLTQSGGLVSIATTTVNGSLTNTALTSDGQPHCVTETNGLFGATNACDAPLGTGLLPTTTISYITVLDSTTTVVSVNNTTTATTFYSFTVPSSTLGTTGKVLKITALGTHLFNGNSTVGFTMKMLYGGQTVFSKTTAAISTSTSLGVWSENLEFANASGTTNNQLADSRFATINGAQGANTNQMWNGSSTVDSTQSQVLSLQFAMNNASSGNTIWVDSVEVTYVATTTVVTGGTGLQGSVNTNQVMYGSGTNQATSSPNLTYDGATETNSGFFKLAASSTVTTPSIGGAIISGGCDSATSSIDSTITSSTAAFITTPINDPGTTLGGTWAYSLVTSPGVLTTRVCSNVSVTPNTTSYIVKMIK